MRRGRRWTSSPTTTSRISRTSPARTRKAPAVAGPLCVSGGSAGQLRLTGPRGGAIRVVDGDAGHEDVALRGARQLHRPLAVLDLRLRHVLEHEARVELRVGVDALPLALRG